jgi:hypothetical protein
MDRVIVPMEDLSYLTTEYARNKSIECYDIEADAKRKKHKVKKCGMMIDDVPEDGLAGSKIKEKSS